jgi:hypothetical protein
MSDLNPREVFEARFVEKLSWNGMREKFSVKGNSTAFYGLMVPYVAKSKAKAVKEALASSEALQRAVARAAKADRPAK